MTAPNPSEAGRGFRVLYRGADTRCPACHHTNWLVGRVLAECSICATAIPLAPESAAA